MKFRWRRRHGKRGNSTLTENIKLTDNGLITLNGLLPGQKGIIKSAPRQPLLEVLGLRPGKQIHLHAKGRMQGPLIVEIDGRSVALGRNIAAKVMLSQEEACGNVK